MKLDTGWRKLETMCGLKATNRYGPCSAGFGNHLFSSDIKRRISRVINIVRRRVSAHDS